jgi:hypothetical protein
MKYLVYVFVVGCVSSSDPNATEDPLVSQNVAGLSVWTPPLPCAIGTWCTETAPVTGTPLLHAVWAASANDVFAVGDDGTIIHRNSAGTWSVMTSGTTNDLRGVWGSSASDVWAGGISGTILHYNGTAWSSVSGATTDVDAVWGTASTNMWFAGQGTVLHWTGSSFTTSTFGGTLLGISGTSASDVWTTGENTNAHHWNGTSWTTLTPGAGTSTYFTVLDVGSNDVWVTDFFPNKESVHYDGTSWTVKKTFSGQFDSLSALGTSDIWGAGASRIGHWDGTAWTTGQPLGTGVSLWSVTAVATDVWVVGDSAEIAHMPL